MPRGFRSSKHLFWVVVATKYTLKGAERHNDELWLWKGNLSKRDLNLLVVQFRLYIPVHWLQVMYINHAFLHSSSNRLRFSSY